MAYFKYLYFNYLTTLQINTQNNLGFSHALEGARAVWLNTQNCAWCGSQISVICCKDSGGLCTWTPLGDFRPHLLCPLYPQMMATPLVPS